MAFLGEWEIPVCFEGGYVLWFIENPRSLVHRHVVISASAKQESCIWIFYVSSTTGSQKKPE